MKKILIVMTVLAIALSVAIIHHHSSRSTIIMASKTKHPVVDLNVLPANALLYFASN